MAGQPASDLVAGSWSSPFGPVVNLLAEMIVEDPTYSAQFCAYVDGRSVIDVWGGPDEDGAGLQGVFSATKGVSAVCIALLVERGLLDIDAPMRLYWPEFAAGGKGEVTVAEALSHQAGVPGVEPQLTLEQVIDHDYVAARIANEVPHWRPGKAHGYHALTIGVLMDELIRRIDGRKLADFYWQEIGEPRGIEFFIATSEALEPRVRDVLPQAPTAAQLEALPPTTPEWLLADSLAGMAFNAAQGDLTAPPISNLRVVRAAGLAAVGGVGTGRGLARLYASCIDEVDGAERLLSDATIATVTQIQTVGTDLILGLPTRFAIGFQRPEQRLRYGSHQAFGHDGAGGAIGVADPWHSLAYGYLPRRMSYPGGADERGLALAQATRDVLVGR